jgi:hypothetical protein
MIKELPEGWEWLELGEVCEIIKRKKPKRMITTSRHQDTSL